MPRRPANLFSATRGRVRASMNKYNLFNLYKKSPVRYLGMSLFQQKWIAKQETRAYHGEHLTEGRWKTLFQPSLESVAQLDASLRGVDVAPTPMVLQTYASLEKRLEVALFRSMFASSVRQARQFIKGGHVRVNGVVVRHGSFPLLTGDVFSVAPEKVMLAMGRVKPSLALAVQVDNKQINVWNRFVSQARRSPKDVWDLQQTKPPSLNTLANEATSDRQKDMEKFNRDVEKAMLAAQRATTRESVLAQILDVANNRDVESLTAADFGAISKAPGADEKCLNAYSVLKSSDHALLLAHSVDKCKEYIGTKSTEFGSADAAKTASQVKKILSEVVLQQLEYLRVGSEHNKLPEDMMSIPFSSSFGQSLRPHERLNREAVLEDESKAKVRLPWQKGLFGRQDPLKPYFTPWTPRPFLGAFAILPHHIEVSFETCHAVYLNDPVARPGHSEVISPMPDHVHERAYMYYVRKGL